MVFDAVEEPEIQLFRMYEHPNTDCPVGRMISSVLDDRLKYIQAGMFEDMDKMKLSDMYADMKKRLKEREICFMGMEF